MSLYCASKFALEGMTAALAEEVKDKGIEVNTLSPKLSEAGPYPRDLTDIYCYKNNAPTSAPALGLHFINALAKPFAL